MALGEGMMSKGFDRHWTAFIYFFIIFICLICVFYEKNIRNGNVKEADTETKQKKGKEWK